MAWWVVGLYWKDWHPAAVERTSVGSPGRLRQAERPVPGFVLTTRSCQSGGGLWYHPASHASPCSWASRPPGGSARARSPPRASVRAQCGLGLGRRCHLVLPLLVMPGPSHRPGDSPSHHLAHSSSGFSPARILGIRCQSQAAHHEARPPSSAAMEVEPPAAVALLPLRSAEPLVFVFLAAPDWAGHRLDARSQRCRSAADCYSYRRRYGASPQPIHRAPSELAL